MERLKSQITLTVSQAHNLHLELSTLKEKLEKISEKMTQQAFQDLSRIKAPSSTISEIIDKFLLILDMKDRSWVSFKKLCKHFISFKNLILFSQTKNLQDSVIDEILPLWKTQGLYRTKLERFPGFNLILDWIGLIVELNLKEEIVNSSQKRIPELEKSVKKQELSIESLKDEAKAAEKVYLEVKRRIKDSEIEDCSESSHTSKTQAFCSDQERMEKHIFVSAVNKGTASGGLMRKTPTSSLEKSVIPSISPNFSSKHLYGEIPVLKDYEEKIIYEGRSETVSCCSVKFLCF